MQDPLGPGLVDELHERDVLGRDGVGVATVDGGLEAPEIGLDGRPVAEVLEPLTLADEDALLLLLDVRHCGANATTRLLEPPPVAWAGMQGGRRMARAAALFSLATGLSRVVGLLREILVAYVFGVRGAIKRGIDLFRLWLLLGYDVEMMVQRNIRDLPGRR